MKPLLLVIVAICAVCEARTLRCANLFDDGCNNGGLVGSVDDESWLSGGSTPGKRSLPHSSRCAVVGVMNECLDGLIENNGNQGGSVGKRTSCKVQVMGECLDYLLESNNDQSGSVGKRTSCKVQVMGECLDYLLEGNSDQSGSVGKRTSCKVQVMGECLDYLLEGNSDQSGSVGKRSSACKVQVMGECLDYLLEGNNSNQEGSTGKRNVEIGASDDESWLIGESPGKRSLYRVETKQNLAAGVNY